MAIQWSNNASTTLAGSITSTDTTISVAAGTGSLFPTLVPGDYFLVTFYDNATKTLWEIMKVTAGPPADTWTVVRAFENQHGGATGATAYAWTAGDLVANLVTAGTLDQFVQAGSGPADTSVVYVGLDTSTTPNQIIANTIPVPPNYAIGMLFNIRKNDAVNQGGAPSNTGATTMALNGQPAYPVYRTGPTLVGGGPTMNVLGGDLTNGEEMIYIYNEGNLTTHATPHFTSMVPPVRRSPPVTTFYVRPDGANDLFHDGTQNDAAHAWHDVWYAMQTISSQYTSSEQITIRVADNASPYVGGFSDTTNYIASWNIIGNTANPGNCIIDATGTVVPPPVNGFGPTMGICVESVDTANITVSGFLFRSLFENIAAAGGGFLTAGNCSYTAPTYNTGTGGVAAIRAFSGNVYVHGVNTYNGSIPALALIRADQAGNIGMGTYNPVFGNDNCSFNIVGTPTFTEATVSAIANGTVGIHDAVVTFTGGIPNAPAYRAVSGGGVEFIQGNKLVVPGSQPVIVTSPGWVLP